MCESEYSSTDLTSQKEGLMYSLVLDYCLNCFASEIQRHSPKSSAGKITSNFGRFTAR